MGEVFQRWILHTTGPSTQYWILKPYNNQNALRQTRPTDTQADGWHAASGCSLRDRKQNSKQKYAVETSWVKDGWINEQDCGSYVIGTALFYSLTSFFFSTSIISVATSRSWFSILRLKSAPKYVSEGILGGAGTESWFLFSDSLTRVWWSPGLTQEILQSQDPIVLFESVRVCIEHPEWQSVFDTTVPKRDVVCGKMGRPKLQWYKAGWNLAKVLFIYQSIFVPRYTVYSKYLYFQGKRSNGTL